MTKPKPKTATKPAPKAAPIAGPRRLGEYETYREHYVLKGGGNLLLNLRGDVFLPAGFYLLRLAGHVNEGRWVVTGMSPTGEWVEVPYLSGLHLHHQDEKGQHISGEIYLPTPCRVRLEGWSGGPGAKQSGADVLGILHVSSSNHAMTAYTLSD